MTPTSVLEECQLKKVGRECCIPLMLQSAFKSIFADRRGLFENPKSSEHPVKKNPVGLTKSKTLPNLLASTESPNNLASAVQNSRPVATPQPVKNNKRVAAGIVNNTILYCLLFHNLDGFCGQVLIWQLVMMFISRSVNSIFSKKVLHWALTKHSKGKISFQGKYRIREPTTDSIDEE